MTVTDASTGRLRGEGTTGDDRHQRTLEQRDQTTTRDATQDNV
jgi:hypothetical protein